MSALLFSLVDLSDNLLKKVLTQKSFRRQQKTQVGTKNQEQRRKGKESGTEKERNRNKKKK